MHIVDITILILIAWFIAAIVYKIQIDKAKNRKYVKEMLYQIHKIRESKLGKS